MADDLVDLLAAMSRLQRFFEDVGSPKGIGADWTLVRSSLLAGAARSPLSQHGGAGGSAADLADYLYRMADDVPLRNSTGLERLLFRWVRATEEMERLLVKICQPAPAAVAMANDGGGGAVVVGG